MRKIVKWALAAGVAVCFASGQTNCPREINGAKTPEKIPDRYAYPALFRNLTGEDSDEMRKVFVRDSGLSESDATVVFRGAERFARLAADGMSQLREARKSAPRPLPPTVLEQYRLWNDRMNDEVEVLKRSFADEISAAGQKKLQEYLLNHVKRNMSVHLGDADIAAGPGPRPETATKPAPAAQLPSPGKVEAISAGKAAALMEEAAKALVVQRVIDGEKFATVELWNGSLKRIAAFQVALCAPELFSRMGLDTIGTGNKGIEPGATYEIQASRMSRPRCDPLTPRAAAVVFEDGTSVGLPQEIERFRMGWMGRLAETERVNRILSVASGVPDWEALRKQIGELPDGDEQTTLIETGLAGVDAEELKAASWDGRSAYVGALVHVRAGLLSAIDGLAAARDVSAELQRERWEGLRGKYRQQCESLRAFWQLAARRL